MAKTRAKQYEFNGESKSIRKWSEQYGLSYSVLCEKIAKGMTIGEAITTTKPKKKPKTLIYHGREYTVTQLAQKFGMRRDTLKMRVFYLGWSVEEAVAKPTRIGYTPMITDKSGCDHYDCLHQDGGGKCQLGVKRCTRNTVCEMYDDAYEYYFGDQVKWRTEGKDPWAEERRLLVGC